MVTLCGIMALVPIGKGELSHCARVNTRCGLTLTVNKGHGLQDFVVSVSVMEETFLSI